MFIDRFTQISAERFDIMTPEQQGHRVILFPYSNYDKSAPPFSVGMWLSHELIKKQIESAHYIPDTSCRNALQESGATTSAVEIWLGLKIIANEGLDIVPVVEIPKFMMNKY